MIARLTGLISSKQADRLIVDVRGVGYEVWIPYSTYYELGAEGDSVTLEIHTHIKEDAFQLYGFLTLREKELFTLLILVSGIGPKLAAVILSGMSASSLAEAILGGDVARLTSIPGIGKKTAERLVLELREKISKLAPEAAEAATAAPARGNQQDVVSALVNLGYPKASAEKAVARAAQDTGSDKFDVLLRAALKSAAGG